MANQTFDTPPLKFPEIFLGIVSPAGTELTAAIAALTRSLAAKGYSVHHIKISSIIKRLAENFGYKRLSESDRYERIDSYITCGNLLRQEFGNGVLANVAFGEISRARLLEQPQPKKFEQKAYIIDQLKTEEELNILREVYGRNFFQVSIYSARDIRVDHLSKIIAHDRRRGDRNSFRNKAESIVVRDENESSTPYGQRVGKIFQLADVVFNIDRIDQVATIDRQVQRFVDLLFGSNRYSPNRLEYGMFLAFSAALRSLDLSRQVGAAIFRSTGEIATLGTNEVPKAGGGTYWADDAFDAREYVLRRDSNDARKAELLNEVIEITLGKGHLLSTDQQDALDRSQFMDALEYGRIVHAEMCAITDAARLGISLRGGTLYCTTFPCHMCSKHIVAAGITKVVFLEPYPKSLTSDLHSDSVKIEGSSRGTYEQYPSVEYLPFFGITPRRYRELFSRGKRKKDGKFREFTEENPKPVIDTLYPWYGERETVLLKQITDRLSDFVKKGKTLEQAPAA